MKCTKPRFEDPTKECEFDHPCPFHDLVIDFEKTPPEVHLPMVNVELIKSHLPWLICIAQHEGEKLQIKKIILTDVVIKDGNIEGNTYIQPHIPLNWVSETIHLDLKEDGSK